MKRVLIVLLVILAAAALVVWVASLFRADDAVATSGSKPWPGGLGTLDTAARRYPATPANEASAKLTQLAGALQGAGTVEAFVTREITRAELVIGEAPALPDVSAIRELLLREQVVWRRPDGVGEIGDQETSSARVVQMTAGRALVASALVKARANDPAAWDDLRAAWNLARSLEPQPQVMTQTAALSLARMINAAAWKMPLPAPPWFAELQGHDSVPRLLQAFHYQAASYWESHGQFFPTKMLAASVEHDRQIAEALAKETRCDVTVRMNELGTDLASVWRRAFRFRAEREATANALRMREGLSIQSKSVCSDGTWSADGTTLRFSREIAALPPDRPMPLTLRIEP